MKHDKRYPNSFLTRLVSLLVAEIFLCSSVLPVWALPTESLRPKVAAERLFAAEKEAADGGEDKQLDSAEKRQRQLAKIERLVRTKQDEFLANATPEEQLDRERALARISHISESARMLLEYPDLFDQYVGKVAKPLLRRDARTLNFILASHHMGFPIAMLHPHPKRPIVYATVGLWIPLILKRKRKWKSAKQIFYLPGFPVIVEGAFLSPEARQTLEKAARLIVESGWPKVRQETFSKIESISASEEASHGAIGSHMSQLGNFIKVSIVGAPETVAETLIHEDVHHHTSKLPRWEDVFNFEYENKLLHILHHPFFGGDAKSPGDLLNELQAYGVSKKFLLHLWDTVGFKPLKDLALIEESLEDRALARQAIRLLKEHPEHLNGEGKAWLREMEKLWKALEAPLQVRWEQALRTLLTSPERELRYHGYHQILKSGREDPKRRRVYRALFEEAFTKEEDRSLKAELLLALAFSKDRDPFESQILSFILSQKRKPSASDGGRAANEVGEPRQQSWRARDGGERNFAQERDLVTKIRRILTETPEKYQELTEEIEAVGPNAIYPLLFLLTDSNREVSEFAFAFIRDHQDLGAHPLVAAALRDEKDENRSRPASALVVLKSKATAPRVVEEALRDTDEKVRERAVRLILLMPEDASRPLVASALRHVEPEVRQRQEDLLFHPEMASHIIGHIASAFLHDPSAEVRERALEWLKRVPEEAASHLGYAAIYERQETRRHRAREAIIHHFAKEGTQFLASFYVSRKHKHTGRGEERSLEILGQIWRSTPEAIRALRFHQSRGIRRFARAWLGDPPDPTRRSAGDGGQREAKDGGWIQGQLRKLVQSGEIQFLGGDDLTYQRTLEAFAELVLAFIKNPTSPSTDEMYRGFLAVANFVEGQFHIKIVFKKGRGLPKLTRLVREGRGEVKNSAPDGGRSRDGGEKLVSALLAGALVLPVSVPHASIPKPSPLQGLTRDPVLNYLDTVSQPGVHLIGRPFLSDDQIQTLSTAIADKEGLGKPADDPINQEYRKRIETLLREYGEVLREEEAALQEIASAIGRGEKVVLAVEGTGQTLQQLLIDAQEQYRVFSGWMQQRGFEDYRDKAKQLLLLMGGEPAYLWVTSQDVTLYPLADSALYEKGQSFLGRFKEAFEALAQTRRKKGVPDDLIGKWHTDTSQALGALGRDPTEEEIENFLRPLEDPAVKKEARQLILRTLPIYRTDREQQEMMGRRLRQLALTQGLQFRTTVFAIVTDKRREALAKFLKANNIKLASEAKDGGDIFHAHPFQETTRSLLIPTFSP